MKKVLLVFGTRPEAIKMAPLALTLARPPFRVRLVSTGQHREMLDAVLRVFRLRPHHDLALMKPDQTLADLTGRCVERLDPVLVRERPDIVLVQGDTTTAFAAALAAFYRRIPVGHVEAGLRTYDKYAPFPEEINRRLISAVADIHFAPTESGRRNLLREAVPAETVHVTGNTVIDALVFVRNRLRNDPAFRRRTEAALPSGLLEQIRRAEAMVLVTGHRRENFGQGFENICRALAASARRHPRTLFVYPVHLNPNVRRPVFAILSDIPNIRLIEPVDYPAFVLLMTLSRFILTDSGGVQEEAPSLGKPVLVMREVTERPEAVKAGTVRLVGTDPRAITDATERLLRDSALYRRMATAVNPYGDGRASARIRRLLRNLLLGRGNVRAGTPGRTPQSPA